MATQHFSLSPVDVDDPVLVDKLKDVGGVHEDADGADGGDEEEKPQLGSVDHHGHVLPILSDLKQNRMYKLFKKEVIQILYMMISMCALSKKVDMQNAEDETAMQGQCA